MGMIGEGSIFFQNNC